MRQAQSAQAPEAAPEPQKAAEPAPVTLKEKVEAKKEEVKDALLESPFARHAAVLVALVLLCMVGHAIYVKCHADKAKIEAGLSALPIGGPVLSQLFDKLDAANTALDAKVQALKAQVAPAPVVAPAATPVAPATK